MNSVLITGGTGFIGQWMQLTAPDELDASVYDCLGRHEYELPWEGGWDYIIHLAPAPVDRAIRCGKWFNSRILYASSAGVLYERDEYMQMKADDERKLAESGIDYRIARIYSACGRCMKWDRFAIGQMIREMLIDIPVTIPGDPRAIRSYLYGADLARWLWYILLEGERGVIYSVGSPEPVTMFDLAWNIAGHKTPRLPIVLADPKKHEPRPVYYPANIKPPFRLMPLADVIEQTILDYLEEQ